MTATARPEADVDFVDVILYVTEDPKQEGDLAALLDLYFEFFTKKTGWHQVDAGTKGKVLTASFNHVPPKQIKEILSRVDWGRRAPAALIKDIGTGLRHTDVWVPLLRH